MIRAVAVDHYRSLRRLRLGLGQLTVVTGPNGSGKSNLYRALRLLADSSRRGIAASLATEGGLASALWAGARAGHQRPGPVTLRLGVGGDDFGYAADLGLPVPQIPASAFDRDPEIKLEAVWGGPVLRPATLLVERRGPLVRARETGRGAGWERLHDGLRPFDSVLDEIVDADRAPELITVREQMRSWRFYDQLRTDAGSPARAVQVGTRTPVLDGEGSGLAAAWQTIVEIGDRAALGSALVHAFPGSSVDVEVTDGRFELRMRQPGLTRPLTAAELSDGTLRFLMLAVALLSPRPPQLLVLNEPETSLHPDLLPALATLVARAATRSQVVVVSHSERLVRALDEDSDVEATVVRLVKDAEGTHIEGQGSLDEPPWHFPER